jgi:hypothetical protein
LAFSFDREGRTDTERAELTKNSNGAIRFISRRMYENFLLNPRAISAVLSAADSGRATPVAEVEVARLIQTKIADRQYCDQEADWVSRANAAKLLQHVFNELSEARVAYDKVKHGTKLTEWIIDNSPGELEELKLYLEEILRRTAP